MIESATNVVVVVPDRTCFRSGNHLSSFGAASSTEGGFGFYCYSNLCVSSRLVLPGVSVTLGSVVGKEEETMEEGAESH